MANLILIACKNDVNNTKLIDHKEEIENTEVMIKQNKMTYLNLVELWKGNANGQFSISKKIDEFEFISIYKPYSILLLEEVDTLNLNQLVTDQFKTKTNQYNTMHFFNFTIKNASFKHELIKLNTTDNQMYYDRIAYYSFASKNDTYVVEDLDTLKCDFVNFERTFDANPSIMLSFGFTRKSKLTNYKKLTFVFEDKIFNKGRLNFNFDTQPIILLNYLKPLS